VDRFTVVTTRLLPDLFELREYQFAGTTPGSSEDKPGGAFLAIAQMGSHLAVSG